MDKYSHGQFEVSGITTTINNRSDEQKTIGDLWEKFAYNNINKLVIGKEYLHTHVVYYNYFNDTYDIMIGFVTKDGIVQNNETIKTIQIPSQNYNYIKIDFTTKDDVINAWDNIRTQPHSIVSRTFEFDLEMYSEDFKTVTIAVSVD